MQLTTLTAMLFAAFAIAGPIAMPAKEAAANVEVSIVPQRNAAQPLPPRQLTKTQKAVRDAEPILGKRASCSSYYCGPASGCPSGCGGCVVNPQFGGGFCANK